MADDRRVAYFSMEIGLDPEIPTYSGGLGILAGDTVRAAADLSVPMVAVSLLHRKGYLFQRLDAGGWQTEEPVNWPVDDFLTDTGTKTRVMIEGRTVHLRAWLYEVKARSGFVVPVYFLDADLPENTDADRTLTHSLYGGDQQYRLFQEIILGMGGVRMLATLGYRNIQRFHMNEGHASFLTLELLRQRATAMKHDGITEEDIEAVRRMCVFTTHTPVPAGHDQFPLEMVERALGPHQALCIYDAICQEGKLNMTYLALTMSRYINGVAKRHGEVSQHLFAAYKIDSITNGVRAATWVSAPFAALFDQSIPGWREDNFSLRYALSIAKDEIWQAHRQAKRMLVDHVNGATNAGFDIDLLTIGFARRAATYKRADLLFDDLERLRRIAAERGKLQIVFAGKAHPQDEPGKKLIQRIIQVSRALWPDVPIVYLSNYDITLAKLITAGVDVWLNTPLPPMEASGTSGMKAALNGVPSLSILDGWWIEGCIEGITGWAIGEDTRDGGDDRARDAQSLYQKLEEVVVPMFYRDRDAFVEIMRHAIALNGSFFNTQRMMQQYVLKAYFES